MTTHGRTDRPWLPIYDRMGIPHDVSYPENTIYENLRATAEKYPKNIAVDYMDRKFTFSDMIERIDATAKSFYELGLRKGDTISICLPNIPQCIFAFYAANLLGVKACMIHPLSAIEEIRMFLKDSGSKLLVTVDMLYPRIREMLRDTAVKHVVVCRIHDYFDLLKTTVFCIKNRKKLLPIEYSDTVHRWKDIQDMGDSIGVMPRVAVTYDDVAAVLYSGGTSSGVPKGIMLTSMNFNALAVSIRTFVYNAGPTDAMLTILPLFHGFGLGICVHSILCLGMKCILVPQFSTAMFIDTIRQKKPTFIAGVPSMYLGLLEKEKSASSDYSFLKGAFCGGDTVPPTLKKRFNEFMRNHNGSVTLREGYGLTETVTAASIVPEGSDKLGSFGIPFPGLDFKVVEIGTTKTLAPGEHGEICIRGETVMAGYLNSPEETARTLRKHEDGNIWMHSGDMGYMDEEGYFFFDLRIKRILKVSGYPVYPTKIEEAIQEYPGVDKCCVIGIRDDFRGQVAKAFVVMIDHENTGDDVKAELLRFLKPKLNKWSMPAQIEFRDDLPLTKVGKVNAVALEQQEKERGNM